MVTTVHISGSSAFPYPVFIIGDEGPQGVTFDYVSFDDLDGRFDIVKNGARSHFYYRHENVVWVDLSLPGMVHLPELFAKIAGSRSEVRRLIGTGRFFIDGHAYHDIDAYPARILGRIVTIDGIEVAVAEALAV